MGDVHGCLDELKALLSHVGFRQQGRSNDALVLAGDLVSKGPYSAGVVAAARKLGALSVRGNHDDSAIEAWRAYQRGEKSADEDVDWVRGLTAEDAEWMQQQPFTLRLRDSLCVVHGGLVPGVKLKKQSLQDIYTMRDVIRRNSGWVASANHTDKGCPWGKEWRGRPMARHVIFGHDAKRRLQLYSLATGLDTGCVYGGRLSAVVVPPRPPLLMRWGSSLWSFLSRRSKRALTLAQLGATVVSVPSHQPPGK